RDSGCPASISSASMNISLSLPDDGAHHARRGLVHRRGGSKLTAEVCGCAGVAPVARELAPRAKAHVPQSGEAHILALGDVLEGAVGRGCKASDDLRVLHWAHRMADGGWRNLNYELIGKI
ncbi:MAG: hypothetical protein LQ340_006902, partial [Diploschistes diacapsis]